MPKVVHRIETYLGVTQNWVYPQITAVPGAEVRVICRRLLEAEASPLRHRPWLTPPAWRSGAGLPRLANALAGRAGRRDFVSILRAKVWGAELFHAHFGTEGWESLETVRRLKVPLITSFYGFDAWRMPVEQPSWRERYLELFAAAAVLLVEGPAMVNRLQSLGCPPEKIEILRIGVDLDRLSFAPRTFRGALRVLMMGRFVEKKGMIDGLEACARARAAGADLTVTIVGCAAPEDAAGQRIKARLETLAAGPELAGRVRLTGCVPLDSARRLLAEHDLFLCPSRMAADGDAEGGSPVALTEAMASGLVCLGTRHCDIPEVIRHGQTGCLVGEGDVASLAEELAGLNCDRDRLVSLAAAGRRHIEANFSLRSQLERLGRLYGDLAA